MAASGCTWGREKPSSADGIPFERVEIDQADLPGEIQEWVQANFRRQGTFVKHADQQTYLLVAWGEKPTGGYAVRVEDVARGRQGEVVVVSLDTPDPDQLVTQAITHPFDLVRTGRLTRSVRFTYLGTQTLASEPVPPSAGTGPEEARSQNFVVTSPLSGATITSPVTVAGRARVFEATFIIEIEDGHNLLARRVVTAHGGAPEWGEFDVAMEFSRPTNPAGAILFVTEDPRDGSRREELILPVRFAIVER